MKKLTIILTAILLIGTIGVNAAPVYTDNTASMLSELKIMQGDPDGNMRYSDYVSRAEFTKIAVAMSAYRDNVAKDSKVSPFKDVLYSHWASPYIIAGVNSGLCKGYLDATFRPDNTVLYEEAATMFLKVLGYTDDDFGGNWPDGQVGIALNIGMMDGVEKNIGEPLTRRDVAKMAYNTLITKMKGSQFDLLSIHNRTIIDDVVLISTSKEDKSVPEGKIYTSAGTYNYNTSLDVSQIGKSGSIVLRNTDTIVSFIPQESVVSDMETQMVYSTLGNGIVTYKNGAFSQISIDNSTVFYRNSAKISANEALASLKMGDTIRISYKADGDIEHIICTNGVTEGPLTVKSASWCAEFGAEPSSVTVMRDGVRASVSDVKTNDIAYYLKELNIALVYSKKVTGIYENALPNKDAPASVTVSGVTYKIEGIDAFSKLSSSGNLNYGDTVTLLLGKSGDVAGVAENLTDDTKVTGFLSYVGTKDTIVSGTTVTKPFIRIVLPDGEVREYITEKDYENYLNRAVTVKLTDGLATISSITRNHNISGKVSWDSGIGTLGSHTLASDVKIIETSTTESYETATVASVYPQRLNGIKLSEDDILYVSKNSVGNIDEMILRDATGDTHTYGIVTSAENMSNDYVLAGNYEYIVNGTKGALSTQNKTFGVSTGQAVRIKGDGRQVTSMTPLSKINATKITEVSGSTIIMNNNQYILSDKVQVYVKETYGYEYSMITLDELAEIAEDYTANVYTDKASSSGGRVRIIILRGN